MKNNSKKHFVILEKLGEFLEQNSFKVSYDERPSDNPQSEVYYDLTANKEESKVIVVILSSTLEHNIELLYHIEYLKIGGKNIFPIIISLGEPNRQIQNCLSNSKCLTLFLMTAP